MDTKPGGLEFWRKYFRSANTDIFQVIENAIVVAASDCPQEFKNRRDGIAEKLFTCRLSRCFGCDRFESPVAEEGGDGGLKSSSNGSGGDFEAGAEGKESKVNSSSNDHHSELMNMNRVSNYSYDEAEALTEEIEEESQIVGEVVRIKEILYNSQDETERVLFESLRRLQLMALSVEALQATEIGKAVNHLRKHGSKQIRHLARALIDGWKLLVDEWVSATAVMAGSGSEGSPDSVKPSGVDEEVGEEEEEEEGLPSPPLDEAFLFATPQIELSQFFDGMDDDGNPRNNGEFDKKDGSERKPAAEDYYVPKRKPQPFHEVNVIKNEVNVYKNESNGQQMRKKETEQVNAGNTHSEPRRYQKPTVEQKANNEVKLQRKLDSASAQRRPLSSLQDKSKGSNEDSVRMKLEAAKRKLHEGYQQAENAKKQRTIQVMELQDLPKQGNGHFKPGLAHRNPHVRPGGGHNRSWTNGRR